MTYQDIPIAETRPEWAKAFSQPLRQVIFVMDDEKTFEIVKQHFAKENKVPDVAVRCQGQLIVGVQ